MITTFESITNVQGTREDVGFELLTERLENARAIDSPWKLYEPSAYEIGSHKWNQRGWSPATFTDDVRAKTSVERVSMLVYDIDSKLEKYSPESALEALKTYSCFIHTTASHAVELPRFRLIVKLSRDVSTSEYAKLWQKIAVRLFMGGVKPDSAVSTPGKFWFWYTPVEGRDYFTLRQHGMSLDPDALRGVKDIVEKP